MDKIRSELYAQYTIISCEQSLDAFRRKTKLYGINHKNESHQDKMLRIKFLKFLHTAYYHVTLSIILITPERSTKTVLINNKNETASNKIFYIKLTLQNILLLCLTQPFTLYIPSQAFYIKKNL